MKIPKKGLRLLACAAMVVLAFSTSAWVQMSGVRQVEPLLSPIGGDTGQALNETPELWFVELESPPTADGGSLARVKAEKQAFRNAARAAGINFTERYAFDTLWNGLSIRIDPSMVGALTRIEGVKNIYPVDTIPAPPIDDGISPELSTALTQTGADVAQNTLGLSGAGIRVAVMDSGIDYDHDHLGGDGVNRLNSMVFPTSRVTHGWDFVGDAYTGPASTPMPDPYPDDCNGHGTHVAGIVGANGSTLKGVAPNVTFGAYRVFGCGGSTSADIMIAAMERALADNMHVLNMSIGSAFQWPQYPTAAASDRLVNKGMVVVASIGNSGSTGVYSSSAPGVGKKVIGVASFDNRPSSFGRFTISPDDADIFYRSLTGTGQPPPPPTSGTFPMMRTGTSGSTADACAPLAPGSLTGHVALIRRGTCTFHAKSLNAQNAGAVGVVIYNNVPGRFLGTLSSTMPLITIPVVSISDTEGVLIDGRLASGPVDMTWTSTRIDAISSFSSYGLSPDLDVKPDIGAPGGSIRSTYPLQSGGFATLSGTSMSSPHTAGAVALLLEAKPNTPSQVVRTILQNSADPQMWSGDPALGLLDNVHRQGAGMLDIPGAVLARVKIEPGKLALGESEPGPATRTLWFENNDSSPVTLDLSFVNALSTGGSTFSPSFFTSDASVGFSSPTLVVPANGTASVDVTVNPPTGPNRGQYGGYIEAVPYGGGPTYRVPFAGFIGDYQSIPVIVPTPFGFPWLAKLIGSSFFNQPTGATYTLAGGDIPWILAHFDHQVRILRMEVFDAATGRAWHRVLNFDYFPRNTLATSFFAFAWDGITVNGRRVNVVPNGTYVIRMTVLKALGDVTNPAHVETWTSPPITLARP